MWSSSGEEQNTNNCKSLERGSSFSSSSSSTTSSSSSTSPFSSYQNPRATKTMEEVWKDINLSSLQDKPSSRDDPNTNTFRGMIFQDFLARPLDKDPQATVVPTRYGSPAPPHPATMLTLNSGPEFHLFGGNSNPLRHSQLLHPDQPISHACSLNYMQFEGLGSCAAGMNAHGNGKKRFPEPENNNNPSGERRHKRMIKNRESAARSRARKQECLFLCDLLFFRAYTNELELEVAHLTEENTRLKEQQRQLCLAAADQQVPRKHALYRTLTAPF